MENKEKNRKELSMNIKVSRSFSQKVDETLEALPEHMERTEKKK